MYVVKSNIIQMESSTLNKTRVSHARAIYVLIIYYKKVQKIIPWNICVSHEKSHLLFFFLQQHYRFSMIHVDSSSVLLDRKSIK